KTANLAGGVVRPHRNGLAHGKPPQFAILNHAAIDSGIPRESVTQRLGINQPEAEVGLDLGVSALATLSTGEIIVGPKSHAVALKQLRRASRAFSRKRRGSANARKAKARLARVQRRIANIRRDATHKLTTSVTKTFAVI